MAYRQETTNTFTSNPASTVQVIVLDDSNTYEESTALSRVNPVLGGMNSYFDAVQFMQEGNWQNALPILRVLKAQYPRSREIESLLNDATLRSELEESWGKKVKGRRFSFSVPRVVATTVALLLITALVVGGFSWLRQFKATNALAAARQSLVDRAQAALQSGEYQAAIAHFSELLGLDPQNIAAQDGRLEAEKQLGLQSDYEKGVTALKAGNYTAALLSFGLVQDQSPGYRDVAELLAQIKQKAETTSLFTAAEAAYKGKQWGTAVKSYEALRLVNSDYQQQAVEPHLLAAYLAGAKAIVTQPVDPAIELPLAADYFRKALTLKPGEPTAKQEGDLLDSYLGGKNKLTGGSLDEAAEVLQGVYAKRPKYLAGLVAEELYQAYLTLGARAEQSGNLALALRQYQQAAALQAKDVSTALNRRFAVWLALQPEPTPTVVPTPPPAATPIPVSIKSMAGWLIFESKLGGLWVMRPDGTGLQPAPYDAKEKVAQLVDSEKWSPDHNSRLYVKKATDQSPWVEIFKRREDLPENWRRDFMLTDFAALAYDPAWSPSNDRIVFVSNDSGNDEIWTMDPDGGSKKQLTRNTWEWDKHPSWSPDGSQIVFFSNRTGTLQLWVMNPDGSNPRMISDGKSEYWNPFWIK